jgi:hypothetical protein
MQPTQIQAAPPRDSIEAALERFIRSENIALYRNLLADPDGDPVRACTIRKLLADEEARGCAVRPPRPDRGNQ